MAGMSVVGNTLLPCQEASLVDAPHPGTHRPVDPGLPVAGSDSEVGDGLGESEVVLSHELVVG